VGLSGILFFNPDACRIAGLHRRRRKDHTRDAMFSLKSACILILLLVAAAGFSQKPPEVTPQENFDRRIAVQLFEGSQVELSGDGSLALECHRGVKLSEVYYLTSRVILIRKKNGIAVHDESGLLTSGLTEVCCKPRNEESFVSYDNKSYRGYLRCIYRDDPNGMVLLNIIDLEDYLMGVLPGEIGERTEDEFEAARAQAVAARTYAVWRLTHEDSPGRLFPTIADQLYLGRDSEMDLLSRAVKETEGEIIVYDGLPIAAYYHAVCGGHTSAIEDVWPEKGSAPYLRGVDDDLFCSWARTYSWTEVLDYAALRRNLTTYFASHNGMEPSFLDDLNDIQFEFDPQSGRAEVMRITAGSVTITVRKDQIRWALGRAGVPDAILPSTRFRARRIEGKNGEFSLILNGTGNGHGVGICQCGMIGRARAGRTYVEILKAYYKGIDIKKIY
jgi:stage II sporulation protein D